MKLISMVDFVFKQDEINGGFGQEEIDKVWEYAKFINQPLELGMFVPCDEDGNILKEPKLRFELMSYVETYDYKEYKKAKERVLFEGFEDKEQPFFAFGSFENRTIEDLVKYNLTLTPNVIKKI